MLNLKPAKSPGQRTGIDFADIARRVLAHANTLLPRWLPHGERRGHEYVALNPRRGDKRLGPSPSTHEPGGGLISRREMAAATSSHSTPTSTRCPSDRPRSSFLGRLAMTSHDHVLLSGVGSLDLTANCTLEAYAAAKNLPLEYLQSLGLETVKTLTIAIARQSAFPTAVSVERIFAAVFGRAS